MIWACLILALVSTITAQVAPTWLASPYIEAANFVITNNAALTGNVHNYDLTFVGTFPNPQIVIAMNSNSNTLRFRCMLTSFNANGFREQLTITPQTQMWTLRLRYIVYAGNQLGIFAYIYFYDFSITATPPSFSETKTLPGSTTFDTTHNIVAAAYLTGFQASSASDYSLRSSCSLVGPTTVRVTINFNAAVTISKLTVYCLLVDYDALALAGTAFVDYGTSYTNSGVLMATWSPPYGLFDSCYLHGMKSVSLQNSALMSLTISGTSLATSTSMTYAQSTHFHVRIRQCPSGYSYYSARANLCYNTCPATTYPITANTVCAPCLAVCATCSNANTCDTCLSTMQLTTGGSPVCVCSDGYYSVSTVSQPFCSKCHYSCLTCSGAGANACDTCNSNDLRSLTSGSVCSCLTGSTEVNEVSQCQDNCGDGVILKAGSCDDSNTANYDGCSSKCVVEQYWLCENQPSQCYLTAQFSLTFPIVEKQLTTNTLIVKMGISPYVPILQNASVLFQSDPIISSFSYSGQPGYLVLRCPYDYPLDDLTISIMIKPPTATMISSSNRLKLLSRVPLSSTHLRLQSTNGYPLTYYPTQAYTKAQSLLLMSRLIGYLAIGVSIVLSCTPWRLVAIQLLYSLQLSFLSLVLYNSEMSVYLASLKELRLSMGWNRVYSVMSYEYTSQWYRLPITKLSSLSYELPFSHNINVMLILQLLSLLFMVPYTLFKKAQDGRNTNLTAIKQAALINQGPSNHQAPALPSNNQSVKLNQSLNLTVISQNGHLVNNTNILNDTAIIVQTQKHNISINRSNTNSNSNNKPYPTKTTTNKPNSSIPRRILSIFREQTWLYWCLFNSSECLVSLIIVILEWRQNGTDYGNVAVFTTSQLAIILLSGIVTISGIIAYGVRRHKWDLSYQSVQTMSNNNNSNNNNSDNNYNEINKSILTKYPTFTVLYIFLAILLILFHTAITYLAIQIVLIVMLIVIGVYWALISTHRAKLLGYTQNPIIEYHSYKSNYSYFLNISFILITFIIPLATINSHNINSYYTISLIILCLWLINIVGTLICVVVDVVKKRVNQIKSDGNNTNSNNNSNSSRKKKYQQMNIIPQINNNLINQLPKSQMNINNNQISKDINRNMVSMYQNTIDQFM